MTESKLGFGFWGSCEFVEGIRPRTSKKSLVMLGSLRYYREVSWALILG